MSESPPLRILISCVQPRLLGPGHEVSRSWVEESVAGEVGALLPRSVLLYHWGWGVGNWVHWGLRKSTVPLSSRDES